MWALLDLRDPIVLIPNVNPAPGASCLVEQCGSRMSLEVRELD